MIKAEYFVQFWLKWHKDITSLDYYLWRYVYGFEANLEDLLSLSELAWILNNNFAVPASSLNNDIGWSFWRLCDPVRAGTFN